MTQPLRRQPLVEQTAAHLREGFISGRWSGTLPGVLQLAEELVVSKHLVRGALRILEAEGSIEDCGAGRPRRIVLNRATNASRRVLRVAILLSEPMEDEENHSVRTLLGIRQAVEAAGHVCIFAGETLSGMGNKIPRIARLVKATGADAWIVFCGPRPVLEWFVARELPVMAFGGRFQDVAVASSATSMGPAIESSLTVLAGHGHRRICLLVPAILRRPVPVPSVEKFLSILRERGIAATDYNLPDFEETAEGFEKLMEELFRITPPTALMILDPCYCAASLSFLARRGLQVPRDVSIICMMPDPVFRFRLPLLAHFRWPVDEHVSRIVRWVSGVVQGRADQRQVILNTVFVPGGTIGPAKK